MTFYDKKNKRLAVFNKQATPNYWDALWKKDKIRESIGSGKTYHFIKKITNRYVPPAGRILEGGCGTGQVVNALQKMGYQISGVDFASETINAVHELFPNLDLTVQDVRHLNFHDNHFDGYWSLGVIEHFWNGYEEIIKEAHRVLKPNGYLFLSFPVMSPLRKLKTLLGFYKPLDESVDQNAFYEFVLDNSIVTQDLRSKGFQLVSSYSYDALKGIKDEADALRPILQRLYQSRLLVARGARLLLTFFFGRVAGHMILLVFRKTA